VLIAADHQPGNRGWTYAIPVRHVKRLVRTAHKVEDRQSVVILKRRRPTVGMVLDGRPEGIVVSRVYKGSPAEKSGIRVGDRIVAADGVSIRSVYQAVRPTLYKQPGDKMEFVVEHEGESRTVEVVLGGGVELPSAPFANLGRYVRPKLELEKVGDGVYASRSAQSTLREVFAPSGVPDKPEDDTITAAEKIQLLEKALDRYRRAIEYLQDRLARERQERQQTGTLLRSLQEQLDLLKKQLSEN
jgi:membrane-associated protease RseP (regulator of RpoE activity)